MASMWPRTSSYCCRMRAWAGPAEQALQKAALAFRIEILQRKAAQSRHHLAQRLTGRPGVLVTHSLQHLIGHRGDFALGGRAEEQDGVAVVEVDLGQCALDLGKLGTRGGLVGRDPVAVSALALGAGYIAIYLLVGSTPQSGGRAESMLTAVPVLSLGAVLFPELNRQHPEAVTRGLGFAGLIFMFVLVCVFRIWVW